MPAPLPSTTDVGALASIIRRREADWYLDEADGVWFRFSPNGAPPETEPATEAQRAAFAWALAEAGA